MGNSAYCIGSWESRGVQIYTLSPLKSFTKGTWLTLLRCFYLKLFEHETLFNVFWFLFAETCSMESDLGIVDLLRLIGLHFQTIHYPYLCFFILICLLLSFYMFSKLFSHHQESAFSFSFLPFYLPSFSFSHPFSLSLTLVLF